ncbi:hypothetical protein ACFZBM_08815 [Streptomyces lavendulae]|uniref:Uncharacterized protein n=1 Tax=Streptomyces lavendulae subsp. lavendulae TaxID=58340 RepID=A0A2K8PH04_STRLA|nr:hypothetical protein [Streptomyces lavendulae]ATZ25043.1 hypothetical protein SLAV_15945 [Streptomyces lavendulae subsp. lavendulae]QUQ54873.1 hypothetical protein SLLC_14010 [Streptomyces lavendulae subsp. lavendulae]
MGQQDDGRPRISDEEWARFADQVARESADAPAEPSARARMVTERLRREEAERAAGQGRGRFGRRRPVRNDPPGWRTGPAWQEMEGRGKAKRRLKAAAAIVFIAGLALVVVRPGLVIDKLTGKAGARERAATAAPLPAESVRPTAAPEAVYPDRPTLKDPFRGSPALQWAEGAAGIEVPPATAVGGMTEDQVADALAKVKQFLVAANLNPATLRGERPEEALKLLDPQDEELRKELDESLRQPTREHDPLDLFTRYDPAELKPVGDVVKVRGRMWVEPGEKAGQAEVKADFSFVHPFVKVKGNPEDVARTIVRREITFSVADPARWKGVPGALRLVSFRPDLANSACDRYDGYLHPSFFSDPADSGPAPSGSPVDPYDRSKTIEARGQEECGTVSRS